MQGRGLFFYFVERRWDRTTHVTTEEAIQVEVWLYGPIARYGGEKSRGSYAQLQVQLPAGSTVQDLLDQLGLPAEEKGITFVNGNLAALPGLDTDRGVELHEGDRVGISHRKSMWPFQYRFGASLTDEVRDEFRRRPDRGVHHAYTAPDK
jgi:sulfur carrier protein ThiS